MQGIKFFLLSQLLVLQGLAREVPSNVASFMKEIQSKGDCSNKLATGFYSSDGGKNTFSYCGDHMTDYNVVYLQGPNGALANMDIDCDGAQGGENDDGRCGSSTDTQAVTSFSSTVKKFNINDLNAATHNFVVFGNENDRGKNFPEFDPKSVGIEPLSVMAVVCNNKLVWGVWGDTNGDDGPKPMVGEASISLATACYGNTVNGNSGHDSDDVLYIAFPGQDAVPGASAKWAAKNSQEFEDSLDAIGQKLIARIGGSGSGGSAPTGGDSSSSAPPARTTSIPAQPPTTTTSPAAGGDAACTAAPDTVSIPPAANLIMLPVSGGASTLVLTPFLNNGAAVVPTGTPAAGGSNCNGGGAVGAPSSAAAPAPTTAPDPSTGAGSGSSGGDATQKPSRTGRPRRTRTRSRSGARPTRAAGSGGGAGRVALAVGDVDVGECSWPGHCAGATCSTMNDCADDLVCVQGACGMPTADGAFTR